MGRPVRMSVRKAFTVINEADMLKGSLRTLAGVAVLASLSAASGVAQAPDAALVAKARAIHDKVVAL